MMIRSARFNINCLVLLGLATLAGCRSPAERESSRLSTAFHLHLEMNDAFAERREVAQIAGVEVQVDTSPFLDERSVNRALVVNTVDGGYAIQVEYDRHGTLMLDTVTTEHRGRRIAVFADVGARGTTVSRWLAAPYIGSTLSDGVLLFTPDATRTESERIVLGLNNAVEKIKKKGLQ